MIFDLDIEFKKWLLVAEIESCLLRRGDKFLYLEGTMDLKWREDEEQISAWTNSLDRMTFDLETNECFIDKSSFLFLIEWQKMIGMKHYFPGNIFGKKWRNSWRKYIRSVREELN